MDATREESIIFNELKNLCSSSGYAHIIAYFCFRDNVVSISELLSPEEIIAQQVPDRLIRTEISTLIGLLAKGEIDLTLPQPDIFQNMVDQTEALLIELHQCLVKPMRSYIENLTLAQRDNPFGVGSALREPIFYSGESAYDFQYLEFSQKKYSADNSWLKSNKGFSIGEATEVIRNIIELHQLKLQEHWKNLIRARPGSWSMLPAFIFTSDELIGCLNIAPQIIKNVLSAFSLPIENRNNLFNALNDFNIINACPLIPLENNRYLLLQHYNLAEALYESPFYWMNDDKKYLDKARKNRGDFVEQFSAKKLKNVFGNERVFLNLKIYNPISPNKSARGEIDVLVVFGNRAIILQAKSKRLTIEAKKGNDNAIKKDFINSIQNAYDQGLLCAKLLSDEKNALVDSNLNNIAISRQFSEIYIFCVVSDHYPALSSQSLKFLKREEVNNIKPPFIMDIFYLDVITEMLQSPLYFLSYINRRTSYIGKILTSQEITILSFFMKYNPCLDDYRGVFLDDDVASDIDSAMIVRRLGIDGKASPDGALAYLTSSKLGKILKMIEQSDEPAAIDLGFLLLNFDQDTINKTSVGLEKILMKSRTDRCSSDLSIPIEKKETGLTIHSNNSSEKEAMAQLYGHCEIRKYIGKATSWYGLCIHPESEELRFVIKHEYPWAQSNKMDMLVERNLKKFNLSKVLPST